MKLELVPHNLKIKKLRFRDLKQSKLTQLINWGTEIKGSTQSSLSLLFWSHLKQVCLQARSTPIMSGEHTSQSGQDGPNFKSFAQFSPLVHWLWWSVLDLVSLGLPLPVWTMMRIGQSGSYLEDGGDTEAITLVKFLWSEEATDAEVPSRFHLGLACLSLRLALLSGCLLCWASVAQAHHQALGCRPMELETTQHQLCTEVSTSSPGVVPLWCWILLTPATDCSSFSDPPTFLPDLHFLSSSHNGWSTVPIMLGWPKSYFDLFRNILQKNLNELYVMESPEQTFSPTQ